MNRESTPKTGIEYTTTKASHQTYSKYVSLAHKARNQGKKLLNKDEVNELLSKMATVTIAFIIRVRASLASVSGLFYIILSKKMN
jgi:hypothetical protein